METMMMLLIILGLVGVGITVSQNNAARTLESAKRKISEATSKHLDTLARKRLQSIKIDSYGVVDSSAWSREVDYFLTKVVLPTLTPPEHQALVAAGISSIANSLIEAPVRQHSISIEAALDFNPSMSPIEYETYCANLLERAGWKSEVTRATGDQGADVIAKKGRVSVVVQCKMYAGSVGNSAVQEAFAAKRHYRCEVAAVVSTGKFTPSAIQLAQSTGVLLMHHSEIAHLEERCLASA